MAKFLVVWQKVEVGTTVIEAEDVYKAKEIAENLEIDFGDPTQFTPDTGEDYGWEVQEIALIE